LASYLWSDSTAYKLDYLPTRCIFGSKYALPNRLFAFSYVNCAPSQGSQIEHYSLQSLRHNGHKSPYLPTYQHSFDTCSSSSTNRINSFLFGMETKKAQYWETGSQFWRVRYNITYDETAKLGK